MYLRLKIAVSVVRICSGTIESIYDQLIELQRAQFTRPRRARPASRKLERLGRRHPAADARRPDQPRPSSRRSPSTTSSRPSSRASSRACLHPRLRRPHQPGPPVPELDPPDHGPRRPATRCSSRSSPTRAVAGTQAGSAEKGALTTTATKVGTGTFAYKAVFGGADISIQMIQRAEAGLLRPPDRRHGRGLRPRLREQGPRRAAGGLHRQRPAVAHTIVDGGNLDPENRRTSAMRGRTRSSRRKRAPTHIWMSAAGVAGVHRRQGPAHQRAAVLEPRRVVHGRPAAPVAGSRA